MNSSRAAVHSLSWVFLFGVFVSSLAFPFARCGCLCVCVCASCGASAVRKVRALCVVALVCLGSCVGLVVALRGSVFGPAGRPGFRVSAHLAGVRGTPSEGDVQTGSASLVQSVYSALQPCRQLSNSDVAAHGSSSRFRQSSRSVSCFVALERLTFPSPHTDVLRLEAISCSSRSSRCCSEAIFACPFFFWGGVTTVVYAIATTRRFCEWSLRYGRLMRCSVAQSRRRLSFASPAAERASSSLWRSGRHRHCEGC